MNKTITTLILNLVACHALMAVEFYVSPDGKDSNPGTKEKPFATIDKARGSVAKINSKMTDDIIVHLRGGTYEITSPLVFDEKDSGNNGHKVIFKAFSGETPIVSGGVKVDGWVLHDKTKNIYRASANNLDFRQIYVNGTRAIRARHPNRENEATLEPYLRKARVSQRAPHELGVDPAELKILEGVENLKEIEIVMATHWKQKRARIESFTEKAIQFQSPENMGRAMYHHELSGTPHYYENSYKFLDAPGEFYLNKKDGALYYIPLADEDLATAEVIVPRVETLVQIKGSDKTKVVHDIHFEGISFQHTRWLEPNKRGYTVMQAATEYDSGTNRQIPGSIQLENASQIEITACAVSHTGANGILAKDVVSDCSFVGNHFYDTAAGAIYLWLNREESLNNKITDNTVERYGMYFADACGILVARTPDVSILHNEVRYGRYTGISTGWTWDDKDYAAKNHDVGYNLIHHVMQLYGDGAGIYTLGKIPGMKIHHNYLHDLIRSGLGSHPPAGIYLDNGSCFKIVESNVLNTVGLAFSAQNKPNYDNQFIGNYFNGPVGHLNGERFIQKHHEVKGGQWPQEALDIMKKAGPRGEYRRKDTDGWKYDPARAKGKVLGALLCDGKGASLDISHAPDFEPEQLTLQAWIYVEEIPTGSGQRKWIVNKNANEVTDGHYALLINGSSPAAYLNIGGGGENNHAVGTSQGAIKLKTWHHLAMTYDGIDLKLYLDGKITGSKTINQKRSKGNQGLAIGKRQDGFGPASFKGRIDEVRLHNRALDGAEIKKYFDNPIDSTESEKGLIGYWPF